MKLSPERASGRAVLRARYATVRRLTLARTLPTRARRYCGEELAFPEVLLIGAQKSGTTTMATLLSLHPHIVTPARKEIHYWQLWWRALHSVRWYKSFFPSCAERNQRCAPPFLTYDASTQLYSTRATRLLKERWVGAPPHIIVTVRDPLDRARSAYRHNFVRGRERRSFEDAVVAEMHRLKSWSHLDHLRAESFVRAYGYLYGGRYDLHLRRWREALPGSAFTVVPQVALEQAPVATMNVLYRQLGLAPVDTLPVVRANVGVSNVGTGLSAGTEDVVRAFLAEATEFVESTKIRWLAPGGLVRPSAVEP